MENVVFKNVRVIDSETDAARDVFVKDGRVGSGFGDEKFFEIDGAGMILMPAFSDTHVHFRDPGFTHKEDIESGSRAAVRGGYTSVVLMANTNPVCSSMETVNYVRKKAYSIGLVDVEQVVSVTEGLKGQSIAHLDLLDGSVRFLSDDGKGVMNDALMKKVLELSKERNFVVISHAEDHYFSVTDMRAAENSMTKRDIALCLETGGRLHLAHVSTKEAIAMVIDAKKKGANLTCEITPHHIFGTDEIAYRVNPPLRKTEDIEKIILAIKDGFVDTIATDHAPHTAEEKANGAPGISGIETAFQICLTKLVNEGHIDLKKLSELMSLNPSKMMGLNKGLIRDGFEADLVLIDANKKTKIDTSEFMSKGKNTPFDGREVSGEVLMTFKKGKLVYENTDK